MLLWVNGKVVKFDGPTTYDFGFRDDLRRATLFGRRAGRSGPGGRWLARRGGEA